MSRIPNRTIEDAPEASRALLGELVAFSPTGRPLNMHAQMAHSPAVLVAYTSLRRATAVHGTIEEKIRPAVMLAAASASVNEYAQSVMSTLAARVGWRDDEVAALRAGKEVGDSKVDALTALVREAAADHGRVDDATWQRALDEGWTDEQLAEAFAYLGLTVFTAYFLNYAQTALDLG